MENEVRSVDEEMAFAEAAGARFDAEAAKGEDCTNVVLFFAYDDVCAALEGATGWARALATDYREARRHGGMRAARAGKEQSYARAVAVGIGTIKARMAQTFCRLGIEYP